MNCGVGYRHSLDLMLLWLWHRPVATALSRPLALKPPHAMCAALENTKRQKQKFGNPMFWEVARWSDEISVSEVVRGQG